MNTETIAQIYRAYRNNFVSDLSRFSADFRRSAFEYLSQQRGHRAIRPMLLHIMSMIPAEGIRLTQLAALLEMNFQHCTDLVNEFEEAGYLRRTEDPVDKRARLVHISKRGKALFYDAMDFGKTRDPYYKALLTPARFAEFEKISSALNEGMNFPGLRSRQFPEYLDRTGSELCGHLIQAEAYAHRFINRYIVANGHSGLKENTRWLVEQIINGQNKITELAKLRDISVQAMGRIVKEAETAGYVKCLPDPNDGRSKTLLITERGLQLLADTVDVLAEIAAQFTDVIGEKKFQLFKRELAIFSGRPQEDQPSPSDDELASVLFYRQSDQRPIRVDDSPISHTEILMYIAYLLDNEEGSAEALTQTIAANARGETLVMLSPSALNALDKCRLSLDAVETRLSKRFGKKAVKAMNALAGSLKS